ncbi:retrovirus-related pol polyprotein from transposon TNT 1-94 [Tanacetum coccineum]|uniref:Retrovirus-related pol polyprotein from transposon TNT 1-94 n=2 Tax=Tanacetum coccineum TaxID=301880 RepID=A0ABQ4YCR3_9ASTR
MVEVSSDGITAAIDGRGNTALWHKRLGHMSEKGMEILASKGRIPDLQKAVVGFCEPCVLGEHKKVGFEKSGNTRKLQRLELVHTDVYGPGNGYSKKDKNKGKTDKTKHRNNFVPIGSLTKEEELIKTMNEKATDEDNSNKEKVLEAPDSTKVEFKQEGHKDSTIKILGRRLKMKATKKSKRQKTYSDLEEEEQLKAFLMIVPDEE